MNPATPRVSVIIPTYNRADYLPQAIDSVLEQTFKDVEIIVVDDGSTDDTAARVKAYGDRVLYVPTYNGGVGHARNVGMSVARGQYLAYLDSDDLFYPYMLEIESAMLDRHPEVGIVYAEMSSFDDDGHFDRYHLKSYHSPAYQDPRLSYDRMFDTSVPLRELRILPDSLIQEDPQVLDRRAYFGHLFDRYLTGIVLFTNNVMMRREIVSQVGVRNERVKYWEELDYMLRITRRHRVCFLDVPTYKLRYHPGQISTTARSDGQYIWLRKQQGLLRIVKRRALEDPLYFAQHQERLHRQFAHLHRAVAVPMMVVKGSTRRERDYGRRARRHLARCWTYGHPQTALWLLTFAPAPIRRLGVSVLERLRKIGRGRAARQAPVEA